MHDFLRQIGSVANAATGESFSSEQLVEEVEIRVTRLRAMNISAGSKILLCHGNSPDFFADLLAIWRIGGCAACLDPSLTKPELSNICSFVEPDAVLIGADRTATIEKKIQTIRLSDSTLPIEKISSRENKITQDDDALILFTSGTTGEPKGVVHTFHTLSERIRLNHQWIPSQERRVTLCPLPTHFGHGLIGNALTALLDGGHLILLPVGDMATAATFGDVIDRYEIQFMSSVPALWKIVEKASSPPKNGSLRRVHVGSAPLSADLWKRIIDWSGTRNVVNMYGITETANWISGASAAEFEPADGLIGKMWGGHAAIRTDAGDIVGKGAGELLIKTPSLMKGYFRRPDMTSEVLKDGWFHTGDIGVIDESGVIRLTGRSKSEINRAGMKVHPEEIDLLLESHSAVREACAFALDDNISGEIVAVAIVPAHFEDFDLEAFKAWCLERMVREKVPEKWFVLTELPKTDRGKINRETIARHCTGQGDTDN